MHVSTGKAADRDEALAFEVADPLIGRDPDPAAVIPEERVRNLAVERPISLAAPGARNAHLPVHPTVQSTTGAQPDASIIVCQDGQDRCLRQTLALRVRGHGQVAKPVQAVRRADPDAPFTILEESVDIVAGEAVQPPEQVGLSVVHVDQAAVRRCDPESALAITEKLLGVERRHDPRQRVRLGFPIHEPADAALQADQERPGIVFNQASDPIRLARQTRLCRGRCPLPQPASHPYEEPALPVLIQAVDPVADPAFPFAALDTAIPNRTKLPRGWRRRGGNRQSAGPDRAFAILQKTHDALSSKVGVRRERAALPTDEPLTGADPKGAVARGEETRDVVGREPLIGWRLPGHGPDAIEANEAELRAQPEIAVGRLGDGVDGALGEALADLPRRVRVLADVQGRIQRERPGTPRHQQDGQGGRPRDGVRPSHVRFPHDARHSPPHCTSEGSTTASPERGRGGPQGWPGLALVLPSTSSPVPLFGRSTQTLASSLGTGGANGGLNPLYQVSGPRSIQLALNLEF